MKLAEMTLTRADVETQAERWEGRAETKYDRVMQETIAAMEEALDRVDSGAVVVNIQETLRRGGRDRNNLPALGFARARYHGSTWEVLLGTDGSVRYGRWWKRPGGRFMRETGIEHSGIEPIRFPAESFTNIERGNIFGGNIFGFGICPVIPMKHRPKGYKKLLYLWEATWTRVGARPIPNLDPALLKPIGNGLAEVVDQWDLTPLEAEALRNL